LVEHLQGLLGLIAIPLLAWILSERRDALTGAEIGRMVAIGLAIQFVIAGLLLNLPFLRGLFDWPGRAIAALQSATLDGMRLVFGHLAGGPAPYEIAKPEHSFVLAFQALPLILIVSVLSKLLYHWGILQRIVRGFAWALERSMGVDGPVATGAAANIFIGMVEAPLLIKPYLRSMSRAGLFATMTVGMAGIAGTVLALYASILGTTVPGAAGHLIVASVISVPAALLISALMVPKEPDDCVDGGAALIIDDHPHSAMEAIAQGTREGIGLLVGVTAMLIVAVALVSLVNMMLAAIGGAFGLDLTLQKILGWIFAPLAFVIGIPAAEIGTAGSLLGVKTILNEFVAYLQMAALPEGTLSERSRLIMTYALCGFANFGSLGIMVGGLVAMVPERRSEITDLGLRTIISGTLATLMTASVVGVVAPLSGG
jgi:concentrative nucleoside transporter, CNT family